MKSLTNSQTTKKQGRHDSPQQGGKKPIRSETNYRAIFNAVNDAIFIHDAETGAILDVNRKVSEMYGYTAQEACNLNVGAVSSGEGPFTQEQAVRLIRKAAGGEPQLFEWHARDKNGRLFWIEVNLKRAEIGGKDRLLAVVRDISDRKRAEELLEKERGTFFSVLQKAPYGVVLIDQDETFLYLNAEFTAITGYTLQDVPTREHWLRKAYPDIRYRAQVTDAWRNDYAKKGIDRVLSISCKSGETKQVEVRPTFLDDGRSVLALTDITERRRAEETLRRSKEALSTIFNGVYDAIFLHELDGTIIDVNDKMLELYRVTREQATKLSIIEDYSSRDNPLDGLPFIWKSVITGRNQFFEWRARRPNDGSVFDAEVFLRKITLDTKDLLLATVRDITERKRAETAIKGRNLELSALNMITASVSSSLEMTEVLQTLKTLFMEHLEIPGGSIFFYDESRNRTMIDTHWGMPESMLQAFKAFALNHFQWERTVGGRDFFFRSDFREVPELVAMGLDAARPNWQSYLCVPLMAKGEIDGLACLFSGAPAVFSADQVAFFRTIGQQVGVAIQNARLFEQVRAGREQMRMLSHRLVEVQETERRYVARELHDEVGQVLTGLKLLLEMSGRLPDDRLRSHLEEAKVVVNSLMGLVRELSLKLRPAMLDDLGLLPGLLWHVERFTAQTNVRVHLRHTGLAGRFNLEVETAAYRIAQEALTNVARHAGVDEATVRIWADATSLNVQVADDGAGFNAEAVLQAGTSSGLAGMRERAVLLGAGSRSNLHLAAAPV